MGPNNPPFNIQGNTNQNGFNGGQQNQFQTRNVPQPRPQTQQQMTAYSQPSQQKFTAPSYNTVIGMVHGAAGAGFYWVAPATQAYLFDLDSPKFFIKTVDEYGRPYPLETYGYEKEEDDPSQLTNQISESNFASKDDLESIQNEISKINDTMNTLMSKLDRKPKKEKRNE